MLNESVYRGTVCEKRVFTHTDVYLHSLRFLPFMAYYRIHCHWEHSMKCLFSESVPHLSTKSFHFIQSKEPSVSRKYNLYIEARNTLAV